jgi:O-antigen/teichoic acid export membrane protein
VTAPPTPIDPRAAQAGQAGDRLQARPSPASGDGAGRRHRAGGDLARLARGGMLTMAGSIASSVLGFLLVVVITRGLGAARGGVLFEAIALFMILSNTFELGADTAMVRMVARYRALGRTQDVKPTIWVALSPVMAVGIVSAAALFVLAPAIARVFVQDHVEEGVLYIRLFAPFLPLASATTVALGATRGFGTMRPYVAIQNVGIPLVRPLLILVALASGLGATAVALSWAAPLAAGFVASVGALILLHRMAIRRDPPSGGDPPRPIREIASEFWRFAAPRGLAGMLQVAVIWLNILLVGALATTREAGIFAAASRFTGVGTFALQAVGLAIAPQISALLARDESRRAETVFQTATWWLMALSWPMYVAMVVFAPFLMRVFGPEFVSGQTVLLVLSLAMLALIGTGNNKIVLLMAGASGLNLAITTASLTCNIVLGLVLIPRFGMNGAAIAFGSTIVLDQVLTTLAVRYRLKLQPFGAGYAIVALGATLCYGGVGLAVRFALGMTVPSFLLFGVVATAGYAALLWRARKLLQLGVIREVLRSRGGIPSPGESEPL